MTTTTRNSRTDRKWDKKMTIAEMLPLMSDAEIADNARKGGVAAIAEQKRRDDLERCCRIEAMQPDWRIS